MEKVAGNTYYVIAPMAPPPVGASSPLSQESVEATERQQVRGMHSGVSKAIEAHREMVEERQMRQQVRRERVGSLNPMDAKPAKDAIIEQQVAPTAGNLSAESHNFENNLIEPIESEAKLASVQAFQATDSDRPSVGEPIPKGSYLNVQA